MTPRQPQVSREASIPFYRDRFAQKKDYRQKIRREVYRIMPGDNLYQILRKHGVSPVEVGSLVAACTSLPDLQRLRAGEHLELFLSREHHRLEKVRYQNRDGQVLAIGRLPRGWATSAYAEPLIVTTAVAQGSIKNSLYQSALDHGIHFDLAMGLADIFAWDIDFFVDLRPDDHYVFVYEQRFREGKLVENGRIIAAHFYNAGTEHSAYYYHVPGRAPDYYDSSGRSLRKQFLKSPLRYTRISSGFSKRRLHPILKIYRPHLGIDYAAPAGAPVVAVGDGRVISKRWNDGYGRFIAIRHNSRYVTTYGHLSRYAKGVNRGSTVKQGQVVGYVGATGLATGPHLDFRMKKDGRFVNPLKLRFPAARPVPPAHLAAFQTRVAHLKTTLGGTLAKAQYGGERSPATLEDPRDWKQISISK